MTNKKNAAMQALEGIAHYTAEDLEAQEPQESDFVPASKPSEDQGDPARGAQERILELLSRNHELKDQHEELLHRLEELERAKVDPAIEEPKRKPKQPSEDMSDWTAEQIAEWLEGRVGEEAGVIAKKVAAEQVESAKSELSEIREKIRDRELRDSFHGATSDQMEVLKQVRDKHGLEDPKEILALARAREPELFPSRKGSDAGELPPGRSSSELKVPEEDITVVMERASGKGMDGRRAQAELARRLFS